mmetsp:Transcript_3657/g.5008  ORF Transcript_3657/g.5008 Transcript_3657/m.5008 type:complete len:356 (-) Transcript_3657:193-1260(-)
MPTTTVLYVSMQIYANYSAHKSSFVYSAISHAHQTSLRLSVLLALSSPHLLIAHSQSHIHTIALSSPQLLTTHSQSYFHPIASSIPDAVFRKAFSQSLFSTLLPAFHLSALRPVDCEAFPETHLLTAHVVPSQSPAFLLLPLLSLCGVPGPVRHHAAAQLHRHRERGLPELPVPGGGGHPQLGAGGGQRGLQRLLVAAHHLHPVQRDFRGLLRVRLLLVAHQHRAAHLAHGPAADPLPGQRSHLAADPHLHHGHGQRALQLRTAADPDHPDLGEPHRADLLRILLRPAHSDHPAQRAVHRRTGLRLLHQPGLFGVQRHGDFCGLHGLPAGAAPRLQLQRLPAAQLRPHRPALNLT